MAEPSPDSRSAAGLAKALAPAAVMAAVTVLIPFIFWNWGAPYEKVLRITVLAGLLIPLAISSGLAWRGVDRPWMRPAILAIDAVAGAFIAATIVIILLKT